MRRMWFGVILSAEEARKQERGRHIANRGAVAGTGRVARYVNRLRSPRNIGVKRALSDEGHSFGRVPDNWQDVPRSVERSWKRHRKTRWRES